MGLPIAELPHNKMARITELAGGHEFQRKLRNLGIREGKTVRVLASQPFGGPVVIEVDGRATTIGRGMAKGILVEPVEG
jgi:ferrous iron transport protein A